MSLRAQNSAWWNTASSVRESKLAENRSHGHIIHVAARPGTQASMTRMNCNRGTIINYQGSLIINLIATFPLTFVCHRNKYMGGV